MHTNTMHTALNTVAQTLYNTLQAQYPASETSVWDEDCNAGVGYGDFTATQARAIIPAVLQQLNATDIVWDNLDTTTGYEDTQVTFNIAGVPHYICTCYGA